MPAGTDGNNKIRDCEQGRRRTANLVIKRPIVRCVRCGWRCVVGPQCLENVGARQDRTTTNKAVCLIVCMRYQKHLLCIYIYLWGGCYLHVASRVAELALAPCARRLWDDLDIFSSVVHLALSSRSDGARVEGQCRCPHAWFHRGHVVKMRRE